MAEPTDPGYGGQHGRRAGQPADPNAPVPPRPAGRHRKVAPEPDLTTPEAPAPPPSIVDPAPVDRRWREWPIALVLTCVLISLGVVAANHFRRGSVLLAASVLLATGLRLILPARQAGLLAVRSRLLDVIALGGLGGGLMVLALVVPPPS
ncbi:MAG: DUF3017 domain-containing protein [Sporichthyaceae bacterium]|nr:DUF3017 domain-containing protein [Sporichthyaceae bacterium]